MHARPQIAPAACTRLRELAADAGDRLTRERDAALRAQLARELAREARLELELLTEPHAAAARDVLAVIAAALQVR